MPRPRSPVAAPMARGCFAVTPSPPEERSDTPSARGPRLRGRASTGPFSPGGGSGSAATSASAFRDDGTPIGTIAVHEQPTNVAFAEADRRALYVTAQTSLYRVHLLVPGQP